MTRRRPSPRTRSRHERLFLKRPPAKRSSPKVGNRGRPSRKAARPKTPKTSSARLREDLAVELYSTLHRSLQDLGVTAGERGRALRRARLVKEPPRIAGPLLRDTIGVGRILLAWSREAAYLDASGKPRVLAIRGRGATFETLARRFLPDRSLAEALRLARASAEISQRPDGRIALIGSILARLRPEREDYLAHAVRQIGLLLGTLVHNRRLSESKQRTLGRMERIVLGTIGRKQFPAFMRELRPQIYDLLLRVDSAILKHKPRGAPAASTADLTAVSVGLFVGQQDDLERAGVSSGQERIGKRRPRRTTR